MIQNFEFSWSELSYGNDSYISSTEGGGGVWEVNSADTKTDLAGIGAQYHSKLCLDALCH